nr:MAG TPA: hypothetical protein [Caudoviricetes sp.]
MKHRIINFNPCMTKPETGLSQNSDTTGDEELLEH